MWMDFSRFISIIAVILLHISATFIIEYDLGSFQWVTGNIVDSALRWSVPVFVMISGALLLDTNKKDSIMIFYNKRIRRVAFPIIFWSVFYSAWQIFRDLIAGRDISYHEITLDLLTGEAYYHLWFLFMIFGLYAFAPFFKVVASSVNKQELRILIALSFFTAISYQMYVYFNDKVDLLPFLQFLLFIPFFFLGHYLNVYNSIRSHRHLVTIFVVSWALTALGMHVISFRYGLDKGLYFYNYISIFVVPMSASIFLLLKNINLDSNVVSKLSSYSYLVLGVYLIHPFFLDLILYKKIIISYLGTIPSMLVVLLATSLSSVLVSYIFNRTNILKKFV